MDSVEYVVFVAPSKMQMEVFNKVLSPDQIAKYLRGGTQPLGLSERSFAGVECARSRLYSRSASKSLQLSYGKSSICFDSLA